MKISGKANPAVKIVHMKKKLQNFWYYYKIPAVILLAVLAAGLYLFLTKRQTVESDYNIAIVSPQSPSAEQLGLIQNALTSIGKDQNGDGIVLIQLRVFRFAIGEDGQDMNAVAALDADLVGNESGLFFVEDPEKFEKSTNGIGKAAEAVPVSGLQLLSGCGIDDLYLLMRTGAEEKYALLSASLTNQR